MEDEQYINYGKKETTCEECEKLKLKLIRKVGIKQNTIDVLERELKNWQEGHWELVRINCKLKDKIKALERNDTII